MADHLTMPVKKELTWVDLLLVVLMGSVILVAFTFNSEHSQSAASVIEVPTEEAVARHDGDRSPTYQNQVRSLLLRLDAAFPEGQEEIANITYTIQELMAEKGHRMTMLDIMASVYVNASESKKLGITYSEACALFATFEVGN